MDIERSCGIISGALPAFAWRNYRKELYSWPMDQDMELRPPNIGMSTIHLAATLCTLEYEHYN
jgi:hypothetical protein